MRCFTSTWSRSPIWLSVFLAGCGGCGETASHKDAGKVVPGDASVDGSAPRDASVEAAPVILGFDELPDAGPSDLQARGKHLLEAIIQNDPSLAADIVMPREAWLAARDAPDPAPLYDNRFKTTFASQISHVHHHEKGIDRAVFVSFELGPNPTRVEPRRHEWKETLWRVNHSALTFTIDDKVHRLEIADMIAWRGNWYIARLR